MGVNFVFMETYIRVLNVVDVEFAIKDKIILFDVGVCCAIYLYILCFVSL